MKVTFTNPGAAPVWVSTLRRSLGPGESSAPISRSPAALDAEQVDKANIASGALTIAFVKEPGDDAGIGGAFGLPDYTNATRPAANTVPSFSAIWNTDDNAVNWSDGVAWRANDGSTT